MGEAGLLRRYGSLFNLQIACRSGHSVVAHAIARRVSPPAGPTEVFLCIADHFEPQHGGVPAAVARQRLEDWLRRYPAIAARHRDADGRPPAHTFFYPWDQYVGSELDRLSQLCAEGWGEIELHLHHSNDTRESLREKLQDAVQRFRQHGALSHWPDGRPAFGFVHGNWALDNSRHEGGQNFCGVNDELTVLAEAGCYADFTFPAWQKTSQPRQVNSIFYARDDPEKPKSYDWGQPARVGSPGTPGLMLIPGPLVPYPQRTRHGWRLGVDDGDLADSPCRRYRPSRLDRFVRAGIHVTGGPDRIFVKLHCHGAADANREALLGTDLELLFRDAERRYNDGIHYRLHYVTAREMFNLVRATEVDAGLDVARSRDYLLAPPAAGRVPDSASPAPAPDIPVSAGMVR